METQEKSSGHVAHEDMVTSAPISYHDVENTEERILRELVDKKENAKILRKIDRHIVPIMFTCYSFQFFDKVVINYANVMGLQTDLGMKGQDFSWMATAFFIAFAIAEVPQGYLLQRFPVSKVLGCNVFLWAVAVSCSAATQNFGGMLALRILLGCFEAVITPALVLTTATWYTKRESGPRYGIWYSGLGAAQILGGLVSFGAQHGARNSSFGGWRIMMVVVGVCNLFLSIWILLCLPSTLENAKFLTEEEKQHVQQKLSIDQAGNGTKVFHWSGLGEVFLDCQVWLLALLTILIVIPSGVITTFSATLILGFGYNSMQSALLNMPSGIISIVSTLACTFAILRNFERWLSTIILMVPALIGAGLMSFISSTNQAGKLAGIYLINAMVAPTALIFSWVGANTAGYTKRVACNAAVAIAFSIGNIIGPQTFQTKDAPQYLPAKIVIFAVAGGAIVVAILLRLLYGFRNRQNSQYRMQQLSELSTSGGMLPTDLENDETDRKNRAFIYVY